MTILLITHEMEVVKVFVTAAVIENGLIIENSTMEEMFSHPKAEATKALVRSAYHISLPEHRAELYCHILKKFITYFKIYFL